MIQTEVKQLANNEHLVEVFVPKDEYERVYQIQLSKLASQVKLPGFRPGKIPAHVIKQQFGAKVYDETVEALLQEHYLTAMESSGLKPAMQPELDIPLEQPESGFKFSLKVATWPVVSLSTLDKLKFDEVEVTADDKDIDAVIERLRKSQVSYDIKATRKAKTGDQLVIDFVGFLGDEAFEGGRAEDASLVLGEGRFIPGFEEQLVGAKAGEDRTLNVTFPEDYQATHLAGQEARFEVKVKSVAAPKTTSDDEELAKLLGFETAAALREDASRRLGAEALDAAYMTTRDAAFEALLAANEVDLPNALLEADMRETTKRVAQNMKQQGVELTEEMFADEGFQEEIRKRSERGLKLSVLLQALRDDAGLEIEQADIDAEIDHLSKQYPEDQKEAFTSWIQSQQEQMAAMRDRLLEQKAVSYLASKAKTKKVKKTLSAWQKEQEQEEAA